MDGASIRCATASSRSSPGSGGPTRSTVPVPAGKGLEYKLTMKKGEGLVYNVSYGTLSDPAS